jgi:hypothetical protein
LIFDEIVQRSRCSKMPKRFGARRLRSPLSRLDPIGAQLEEEHLLRLIDTAGSQPFPEA